MQRFLPLFVAPEALLFIPGVAHLSQYLTSNSTLFPHTQCSRTPNYYPQYMTVIFRIFHTHLAQTVQCSTCKLTYHVLNTSEPEEEF